LIFECLRARSPSLFERWDGLARRVGGFRRIEAMNYERFGVPKCLALLPNSWCLSTRVRFEKTQGWRQYAYARIGEEARYFGDQLKGDSWTVQPAYTVDGYLPCTGIKKGYFTTELFCRWIIDELIPCCSQYPGTKSVIVMDNVALRVHASIKEAIKVVGREVRWLRTLPSAL